MRGAKYSLDTITPFQSALTPPFFLFIHHSLPLNYPSLSHPLALPSLPSVAACLDWAETNGREWIRWERRGQGGLSVGDRERRGEAVG